MRVKVLSMAVMLSIFSAILFAQTETELPPLPSKSTIWYALPIQPPPTCQCLKTNLPPPKRGPVFFIDIPISPFWDTVQENRIKNRTIQFGGSATPWKSTVMFGGWPVPRVIFAASDLRTVFEGGVMKIQDENPSRTMGQVRVVLERAVWYVLVGADGFLGQEQIPRFTKSVNFETDFRRRSYGGQGWLGVKFGDFNRSFIAGRYGKGYVKTEGSNHFNVPGINDLYWSPLYLEEFKVVSFSVEGKVRAKRISQSVRFNEVEYKRVVPSPDPLRFGENRLEDMWLRTETEVMPLSHVGVVVILTKDFRDQNRLMFINDYSSARVLLRLAF